MSNSSTHLYDVDYNINGTGPQKLYRVALTTPATDLELASAQSGRHMQASALLFSESSAATLKFKSRSAALTGTVTTTNTSPTITGSGTTFTKDYVAGDEIVVTDGNTLIVLTVNSDTSITATTNATLSVSGKVHKRQKDINSSLKLTAYQGIAKDFSQNLMPLVAEKGGSLVVQTDVAVNSLTVGLMFPAKLRIGNKN